MASGDLRRIVVPNVIVRIGNENIGRMTGKQTIVLNEENKGGCLTGERSSRSTTSGITSQGEVFERES